MTATLVDSSEQPVDENTLVQFSCLEEILDDYGLTEGKESIGMTFLRKHYSKDKQ